MQLGYAACVGLHVCVSFKNQVKIIHVTVQLSNKALVVYCNKIRDYYTRLKTCQNISCLTGFARAKLNLTNFQKTYKIIVKPIQIV